MDTRERLQQLRAAVATSDGRALVAHISKNGLSEHSLQLIGDGLLAALAQEVGEEDPDDEDPDRWLYVECEGSRSGYRDMEWFIGTIDDPHRAELLEIAIQGRGAFRRFRDVLHRWPDEVDRWYAFSGDRQLGRARSWLAAAGYRPSPPA